MTEWNTETLAVLLVLTMIVVFPVGWVIIAFPESPYRPLSGEPVKEAAESAGIRVVNVTDTTWHLPGATGGNTYVLEDGEGNRMVIRTQAFDSPDSRDAAVLAYSGHMVGRGRPAGTMIVAGNHVIHAGPDPGNIFGRFAPGLGEQRVAG